MGNRNFEGWGATAFAADRITTTGIECAKHIYDAVSNRIGEEFQSLRDVATLTAATGAFGVLLASTLFQNNAEYKPDKPGGQATAEAQAAAEEHAARAAERVDQIRQQQQQQQQSK